MIHVSPLRVVHVRVHENETARLIQLYYYIPLLKGYLKVLDIGIDGDSKLRIYDDKIEFREDLTTDGTLVSPTCDIGSSSNIFSNAFINRLWLIGNNSVSPVLWVAQGDTLFGGQISIAGRISATGDTGKLGAQSVGEVMGISTKCWVTNTPSTGTKFELGTKGTLTIPELYNNGEPSTGDLDGWFGDADGNIGLMRTFSTTRFYAKSGGIWRYETLG